MADPEAAEAVAPPDPDSTSAEEPLLDSDPETIPRHALAAWIIDETLRGMPISHSKSLPRTWTTRRAYLFFENTFFLRRLAVVSLVFLSFIELPAWCSAARECVAPDGSELFLSDMPYLDPIPQAVTNGVLLMVLIAFLIYDLVALPGASLHPHPRVLGTLLAALVVDVVWVAAWRGYPPFRAAPYLRAALPLFYWTSLRECTTGIFAVVDPFLDIVAFVALFTLIFGWVVTLLFHDAPEAARYFGTLTTGLYSAFTSVTTADWPMQIMGALDVSRVSAMLFLAFIVIGVFLLFNVLLAVVYNAYTGHIEELVVKKLQDRRASLVLAYDTLVGGREGSCTLPDVKLMFDELRKNKRMSEYDDSRVELVFTALDDDSDDNLSRLEFLDVVDVLQLRFVVVMENVSPVEALLPGLYATATWQHLAAYARSHTLAFHMGIVMVANVAIVVYESSMDLRNKDSDASQHFFALLECAFSAIYIAEMLLKVASQGFDRYWKDHGNRFDFAVTWLLLFGAAYVLYPYAETNPELVRYLILLRCLRLLSVLADVPRFRRLVRVFSVLIPASVPLFSFFFLSLYVFAAAGVALFGGLIYASNPRLDVANSPLVDAYVGNDYWALNFNDLAAGWYTLFSAVIVSYLTEIAEAIAATSDWGDWTKWFFILSFAVNSLVVSNCVVAFVVDLFIMEDEQDNDTEEMIKLEARYGGKRIKVLQTKTTADEVYATMFKDRVGQVMMREALEASAAP